MKSVILVFVAACCVCRCVALEQRWSPLRELNPYARAIAEVSAKARSEDADTCRVAYRNLGFLRAYTAEGVVRAGLSHTSAEVRLAAVMSLGLLCGGQESLDALVSRLEDSDVWVRQAAAVALENVTGQEVAFSAFAPAEARRAGVEAWRKVAGTAIAGASTLDFSAVVKADVKWQTRERAARALALRPAAEAMPLLKRVAAHHTKVRKADWGLEESLFVQAIIRSLGRHGGEEAEACLIDLLGVSEWACYAADALGDCGGVRAADALLAAYQPHALASYLPDNDWFAYNTSHIPALPKMDVPGFPAVDRMPRTAYAILMSLSRLNLNEAQRSALRNLTPKIMMSIPNDHDAAVVYHPEPVQEIVAWLFDQAGVRRQAVETLFEVFGQPAQPVARDALYERFKAVGSVNASTMLMRKPVYGASQLLALSREQADIPRFEALLSHSNLWVKLTAAKALLFLGAEESVPLFREALETATPDDAYGFCGVPDYRDPRQGQDEFQDPAPRWKEPYLTALGALAGVDVIPLLEAYANDERQTLEVQYAAAQALAGHKAFSQTHAPLEQLARSHPYHSVRTLAKEALWARNVPLTVTAPTGGGVVAPHAAPAPADLSTAPLVFIRGDLRPQNVFQIPYTRESYSTTDSGPVFRTGHSVWRLEAPRPDAPLREIFKAPDNGYVGGVKVSYDGTRVIFSCRGGDSDPWWHIYEMDADGGNVRQLTRGYYHDVHPDYMPDGRIVFTTSRTGLRDEYHGYLATGLAVMNADGSGIRVIGMNFGGDAEPIVGQDGRILFTRLEVIYGRLKTEWNLLSVLPDGTQALTLYGPESRDFWGKLYKVNSASPPRHRVLTFSQPQQMPDGRILLNSFDGPFTIGPRKNEQTLLFPDVRWALTTPYPLDNGTLLVAAGMRPGKADKDGKMVYDRETPVDLGLYRLNMADQTLELIYNDPATADFEARPLAPRKRPPVLPEQTVNPNAVTARLDCQSVMRSRNPLVQERARYVRVVEGMPIVTRYQTQYGGGIAWKNHGGAVGRILGVVPLAPDGSFSAEVPADRLLHVQALDSDWRLLEDQLIWMQLRPGESRGCMGCHEEPDVSPHSVGGYVQAAVHAPLSCLPHADDFRYRGKIWYKGVPRRNDEERMRTVNAATLPGRE